MLNLSEGLILYHGSYCEVREPDLAKCAKRKDFGQGFYLTTSKEQAESFLKTSIAKAIAAGKIEESQNYGYISKFEIKRAENLKVHVFEDADAFCIKQLLPNKLKDQYCFKTEEAIKCLKYVEGEKKCLK